MQDMINTRGSRTFHWMESRLDKDVLTLAEECCDALNLWAPGHILPAAVWYIAYVSIEMNAGRMTFDEADALVRDHNHEVHWAGGL